MTSLSIATNVSTDYLKVVEPTKDEIDLSQFMTEQGDVQPVAAMPTALPHYKISHAKDFVRLHPDEENYWSAEIWFIEVPIKGQKFGNLHMINKDLAAKYVHHDKIKKFKLALATKPYDDFFLAEIPTQNLEENMWNSSNLRGCKEAKSRWIQLVSLKKEGKEMYGIVPAQHQDSLPAPTWPAQSLESMIKLAFEGRMVMTPDHPALLRVRGANII
jgi:hypothetical protein